MIRAIALDDEKPALDIIEEFCRKIDFIQLEKVFVKPGEALNYINEYQPHLLFLDIKMPAISGVDFIKKLPYSPMVIFTTAYSEYAVEGFNLDAVDYLLKPYTFQRFEKAVQKIRQITVPEEQPDHLLLRINYSLIKINLADIMLVESLQDYLKIYLCNARPVVVRMTMKNLTDKLPDEHFIRVHRSYLVHLKFISKVRNKTITIDNIEIPISSGYEENFFRLFR